MDIRKFMKRKAFLTGEV